MREGLAVEQYDHLITSIYEAAYDWSKWPAFLERLSECLDGVYLALHGYDLRSGLNTGQLSVLYDQAYLHTYQAYYARINPWIPKLAALPVGVATGAEDFIERKAILKSEFYADWLLPQEEIATGGGIVLFREADRMLVLSGNVRLREGEEKQALALSVLNLIGPHLQRSFDIARQLKRGDIEREDYQHAFDATPNAVLLVDAQARVHYANQAARELFRHSPALSQSLDGRLVINDMDARAQFESALGAISTRHWNEMNGAIVCGLSGSAYPLYITVSPLPDRNERAAFLPDLLLDEGPIALITIRDPSRQRQLCTEMLRSRFGLTEAECELALHLVRGGSIPDYAERRGRSIFTVRNQLQSVLEKTGTHRQAELTALMTQLVF